MNLDSIIVLSVYNDIRTNDKSYCRFFSIVNKNLRLIIDNAYVRSQIT
jgi:hypothetical protein